MRRLLAILLFAITGLTTAAPLLASAQNPDAHLPVCCRRNGAHHCMMQSSPSTSAPTITARCPQFPRPAAVAPHAASAATLPQQTRLVIPNTLSTTTARAELQRRLSLASTRQKRGPPATLIAA